jgi:hypothetical protein
MPDQPSNIRPIDPVAHSAARDPHLLDLHKVYMEPELTDELEGPSAHHRISIVVVRDEASDALRAAADWMDNHLHMLIEAMAVEYHHGQSGKEVCEVRLVVDFR